MTARKTQEQFILDVKNKHGDKYDCSKVNYLGGKIKVTLICKIIEHGEFEIIPESLLDGGGCQICGYLRTKEKLSLTNADVDGYIFENNLNIKRISEYESVKKALTFECNVCKDYFKRSFADLKFDNNDCSNCINGRRINYYESIIDLFLIESGHNVKRIGRYCNSKTYLDLQCMDCNFVWPVKSGSIFNGHGCSRCNWGVYNNDKVDKCLIDKNFRVKRIDNCFNCKTKISWQCLVCSEIFKQTPQELLYNNKRGCSCSIRYNEKLVKLFLNENNIKFEKISIKLPINTKSNGKTLPDFYIPDLNLIIEYNGAQHYRPVKFYGMSLEKAVKIFERQIIRDQQLRDYCAENEINLLEIDGRKYTNNKLVEFLTNYFKRS